MSDRSPVERALAPGHFWDPAQLTWLSPELWEKSDDDSDEDL